ncbi:hypothetical protein [Paraburkholderia sp. RL17-373-BIF-A]|uniref:hypothetical protein n=1 Tax=Paraburkholderia sp. RL17-373-BIF-A TaxID=3031629 RepID=UPI0038B8671E
MNSADRHALALSIVHREAARTLSKADFDLCMRIAKRALGYPLDEYMANIRDTDNPAMLARDVAGDLWDASIRCDFDAFKAEVANALASTARVLPDQLTPPVQDVLGLMLWKTTPLAHALRAGGFTIERKTETEQAVALHWLLGFALKDGDDWQKTAAVALRQLTDAAKQPGDTQP